MSTSKLSPEIESRLEKLASAAAELESQQALLQKDFQGLLVDVQDQYEKVAEKEGKYDAEYLFSSDINNWESFDDIARSLGGRIGGDYGEFEFWIPSNC